MSSPDANASPQSVASQLDGIDGVGNALPYRKAAMLYAANLFGLGTDYAFPERSNTSASAMDQITTLAKVLTRTYTLTDGNTVDIWDAVMICANWVLAQEPKINATQPNSANYTPTAVVAPVVAPSGS